MPKKCALVDRLQTLFDANATLKTKCIQSSQTAIKNNVANRVFDEFPLLIDEDQLTSLRSEYQALLNSGTQKSVREFEIHIIKIACNELLDDTGNIHIELIDLLEWNDGALQIDNYLAVSAFVGMMNIYIANESKLHISENQYAYLAMTKLINHHYGEWIRNYMHDNGISYDSRYDTDQFKLQDIFVKHPLLVLSIFAGGIVGAGIYGAAKVCQEIYNEHKPLTLPEAPRL